MVVKYKLRKIEIRSAYAYDYFTSGTCLAVLLESSSAHVALVSVQHSTDTTLWVNVVLASANVPETQGWSG